MNSDAKYFRIGLFVISAMAILLLGILALGAKSWFEPKVRFETYFDSAIGGLNIGSPVKFRGVPLGKVTRIDFTPNVYHESSSTVDNGKYRYILVEFEIQRQLLEGLLQQNFQEQLNTAAEHGFRIRVDMAGIAGGNYLEIDRIDPKSAPETLPFNWTPHNFYIPSTKSPITQIVNSLNQTLRNLGKVDFDEIQRKMVSLIDGLEKNNQQFGVLVQQINHMDLAGTMDNVRMITEDLKDTTVRLKNDPSQIIWSAKPPAAKSLDK